MISKMTMFSLEKKNNVQFDVCFFTYTIKMTPSSYPSRLATYITSHVFLWLGIMRKCIFAMWFLVSFKLKTMVVKTEQMCKMQ